MSGYDRRFVTLGTGALLTAGIAPAAAQSTPLIESHVHLWDHTRPQGAAWPPRDTPQPNLWRQTDRMTSDVYAKGFHPNEVVGAIAVEASPWFEDNLWLLEQCTASPFMLGALGNLKPEAPEYPDALARFSKHPMFLGIRYGNVWDYDLPGQSRNPVFLDGMKRLADAGLVWEMGNPRLDAFEAMFRVQDKVPQLKIIVEHLVGFYPPKGQEANYDRALQEFRSRGLIGKVSVPKPEPDGRISAQSMTQWVRLYELFGEDKTVSYGFITSPDHRASPGHEAVKPYFAKKPALAAQKYFWANSQKFYGWKPRMPNQPHAA